MSINLIESVRQHLAYARLKKVSPNAQKSSIALGAHPQMLDQASISAVCAALYQVTRDEEEATKFLKPKHKASWLEMIFKRYPQNLEDKIVLYTGCAPHTVKQHLLAVAECAISKMKNALGNKAEAKDVKHYLTTQRGYIVSYLPGVLDVGKLVHNSSLDDASNKMHGPFSDFMHWMEGLFAEPQKPLY